MHTKVLYILDLFSDGLQLDLKEIPLQQGSWSHPLSTRETGIIFLELKSYCQKRKLLLVAFQKKVSFFQALSLGQIDQNKRMIVKFEDLTNLSM